MIPIIWLCFHLEKSCIKYSWHSDLTGLGLISRSLSLSPTETVQMQWSPSAVCRDRPGKSHSNKSYRQKSHDTHSVTLQLWTHRGCCLQIKAVRQGGPRAKHWTWTKIRRESVRPLFLTQQNQNANASSHFVLSWITQNCTQFLKFLFEMWRFVSVFIII